MRPDRMLEVRVADLNNLLAVVDAVKTTYHGSHGPGECAMCTAIGRLEADGVVGRVKSALVEEKSLDIYSAPGTRVRFSDKHGSDYDVEFAKSCLIIGEVYTVKSIDVHSWISYVELKECPGKSFNSVLFFHAEEEEES